MVVISPNVLHKVVKTMTPKKERVEEAQFRGTIVFSGGEHFIRIDGASDDSLTPIANIEEGASDSGFVHGDRVLVLIKNHQAIVTKNLTTGLQAKAAKDAASFVTDITDEGITAQRIIANDTFTNTLRANHIKADDIIAGMVIIDTLDTNYAHITQGVIDNATIDQADVNNLDTNYAHITQGVIDNAKIGHADVNGLNANYAHITQGVIDNAEIGYADVNGLNANYAHITNGTIDNAKIGYADVDGLNANYAHISNGVIDNAKIGHADVNGLNANYAHITNGVIDNAKIDQAKVNNLSANYAKIDLANVDNAWIEDGLIKDAAITDAKILGVSANKLTAGTIDASNITVTNLNASNITTGSITVDGITIDVENNEASIDGEYIEDGTITLNGLAQEVTDKIDGAIETFTGSAVPTLNNYPASSWTTTKIKDSHIGDVYYVLNTENTADGYCYRFAKDGNTYKWILIKDSDVTAALSRLTTAEGKISGLESFESTTSSWITNTDEELSSIKSSHTSLVTVVNKTVKETVQLWFTKANTTAPSKPTAQVTNNSPTGSNSYNKWNLAVPQYNSSYPNYYYCYQWKYVDGTYGWSAVTRDIAMGESQSTARTAASDASTAVSTAETASTNASNAVSTANTASTNASTALSTANTANTNASTALSTANTAASDASSAVSTANTANSNASSAVTTANAAQTTANANIKSSVQLWFTKANTTAPSKPTAHVTTNDASKANQWNIAVPTYNGTYPNYFYCYEYQKGDGTYAWSNVVYDRATTENQSNSRSALSQVATKVETSTFNTLSQTVDSNTANITSLSNVVETKADSSTVTTLSNTVNEVSQTATGNSSKISNLTQTFGTNADGTTKDGDIVHQVSQIDQDLDGVTTRVSKTEVKLAGQYATSSTGAGTTAKVATITPAVTGWTLYTGATVTVKFSTANTATTPTLNVNSTGAKTIKGYKGAALTEKEYKWAANDAITFIYDGTNWLMQSSSTEATRLSTAEASISTNAGNIALKANASDVYTKTAANALLEVKANKDTLTSEINASADTVQINADRVNITGATIFTSGRLSETSLNNAYDAKGSASAVQTNLDNLEIGGRNYCVESIKGNNGTTAGLTFTYQGDGIWHTQGTSTASGSARGLYQIINAFTSLGYGDTYTLSIDTQMPSGVRLYVNFATSEDTANVKTIYGRDGENVFTFTCDSNKRIRFVGFSWDDGVTVDFTFRVKLEKGNKVTDWTPAPEDVSSEVDTKIDNIEVGGRNLLGYSGDYNKWRLPTGFTVNGNELDLNVSGATSNLFRRAHGWLIPSNMTTGTIIVSAEVYSDDWSTVESDRGDWHRSLCLQMQYTNVDKWDSTSPYSGLRYRHGNFGGTDLWAVMPTTMTNGVWHKIVTRPISLPDDFNTDASLGTGTEITVQPMLVRNGHVKFRNIKVERGNKATDWTPAPEDTQSDIADLNSRANSLESRATAYRGTLAAKTDGALTINSTGFFLIAGATISVYLNSSSNYAGKITMNVNGTGVKDVWIGDLVTSDTNRLLWHYGSIITFGYDGNHWRVVNSPATLYGTTCSTAAGSASKVTAIPSGVIFRGCSIEIPMTYENTASAPTLYIDATAGDAISLSGEILYGTGSIKPTKANGFSWLGGMSVIFKYDGKYWRTGNQTIIDGSHILTGTVSADRIGANSITASKMAIGDYNNYVTFTENDPDTKVNTNGAPQIVDGWIYKSNATDSNLHLSPALNKWATAGEKYRVTGTVKTPEGGSATVVIYGRNSSGTAVVSCALTTELTANTETPINGIITISSEMDASTVVSNNIGISFCTTKTWSSNVSVGYCKNMKVERMSGGSLIVDGAITADKIAANSIAIGKLNESTREQITNSIKASDSLNGSIVTWENMLIDDLDVDINPVQDLHGYDKPWSGGAGKNKLENTASTTTAYGITFTVNSDGTVTANGTATADAQLYIPLDTSKLNGDLYFVGSNGATNSVANAYMWDATTGARCKEWDGTTAIANSFNGTLQQVKVVQGNTVRMCLRVMNGKTVSNHKFIPMIVTSSVSDATYEPYSNICPISGYDSVVVSRTQTNIWDEEWEVGAINDSTGQNTASSMQIRSKNYIPVVPSTTYYYRNGSGAVFYYDADKNFISTYFVSNATFTTPANCAYIRFRGGQAYGTVYKNDISINYPSTDHDYHAYDGNTYTIDLNGTRYGGTLDVLNGLLTVTHKMVTVDGNATPFIGKSVSTAFDGYRIDVSDSYMSGNSKWVTVSEANEHGYICNQGEFLKGDSPDSGYKIYLGTGTNCHLYYSFPLSKGLSTLELANEYAQSHPIQFVYELATPITVQLTAQEVSALVGTNTLWANSGDVHVELTGVKDYIDNISDAAKTATNYITQIDSEGIWVTPSDLKPTNTETGAGATGARINANGMEIFQGGDSVALYGDYTRVGKDGEANTRISPNEVVISASENINALRITPDGNEQLVSHDQHINYTLEPGESSTYTFPSDATSGSYIKYRIVGRYYGDSCIFDITDVKVGTSTPIKHITSPFKFDYSADTTSITITNTESSDRIRVDRVTYYATSISPLIEAGGVLTLGNSPTVDAYTLLAVGNGTNSFSVDRAGNMRCRNYGINDFVVEQGASTTYTSTSGTVEWDYRKWYSGFAECWATVNVPSATYAANGGYKAFTFDFPYGLFVSSPRCLEVSGGISSVVHTDIGFTAVNNADSGQAYLINRYSSAVTASGHAYVHAVGSWKTY